VNAKVVAVKGYRLLLPTFRSLVSRREAPRYKGMTGKNCCKEDLKACADHAGRMRRMTAWHGGTAAGDFCKLSVVTIYVPAVLPLSKAELRTRWVVLSRCAGLDFRPYSRSLENIGSNIYDNKQALLAALP
jgi:hypothetical protein